MSETEKKMTDIDSEAGRKKAKEMERGSKSLRYLWGSLSSLVTQTWSDITRELSVTN